MDAWRKTDIGNNTVVIRTSELLSKVVISCYHVNITKKWVVIKKEKLLSKVIKLLSNVIKIFLRWLSLLIFSPLDFGEVFLLINFLFEIFWGDFVC